MSAAPLPSTPRVCSRSSFKRRWRQRCLVDDEYDLQRAVDHGNKYCCCGSMLTAWSREMFPSSILEAEMVEVREESWERTGALLMTGRCSGGYRRQDVSIWYLMGRERCSEAYNRRSFSDRQISLCQWFIRSGGKIESFLGSTSKLKYELNPNIHADRCGKSRQVATNLWLTVSVLVLSQMRPLAGLDLVDAPFKQNQPETVDFRACSAAIFFSSVWLPLGNFVSLASVWASDPRSGTVDHVLQT